VYSFAAARAAIDIYRAEPVVEHVWSHGETLRAGIHALARDARLSLVCTGPPFRMALHFPGADRSAARLKRTLLMQELLKGGVITVTGVMLPSYAHDEPVLRRTLEAIGAAMEMIAAADRAGDLHRQIEIPLL
jgi:glutamate-1-semialdehyde 2,1-aminomutase